MDAVADFLMTYQAGIALATLGLMFAGFFFERFPPSVVAAGGAGVFLLLGYLSTETALEAFSNSAPITIGAMFVLSGALVRTGVLEAAASRILGLAETRPRLAVTTLLAGAFVASAFVSNTPVVLVLIPIVTQLAKAIGSSPQRLLIPLSFSAVLGGACTLIGTSTNLLVDGVAREAGEPGFGLFEITGVGLMTAAVAAPCIYILGRFLLPHGRAADSDEIAEPWFLTDLKVRPEASVIGATLEEAKPLTPRGVKVVGLRRNGQSIALADKETTLEEGDRLIVRATLSEILTLAQGKSFDVGLKKREPRKEIEEEEITEISIGPNHVATGRALTDIPFLSRHPVTILGANRYRHQAGPNLRDMRLKPGDRLLVRGDAETLHAMRANSSLIFAGPLTGRAFRRQRAAIVLSALAAVVILASLGMMPIAGLALIAVAAILILRCVDADEAWASIDGNVLVLIFSMLIVGAGLQSTGAVSMIVDLATPALANAPPFVLILGVYALTSALTEAVTNNAVAVLMTPLVISIADGLGVDARPLIVAVMFGASASFATPIGYQTNTLVYAAGNYRFSDFVRIGVPMNIIAGLASSTAIYFLFGVVAG